MDWTDPGPESSLGRTISKVLSPGWIDRTVIAWCSAKRFHKDQRSRGAGRRRDVESTDSKEDVTGRILTALKEAISRCRGPEESWMAQDLKRAMILIGGLDEEVAQRILDQEGV